ncbi:hypothetical protein [Burkholderia stagnalis]|uniref:Uncharacterized protein n=1 Tax=Burkholderia stagnalis TaxID=1503054 RepID=A0A6L3N3X0_9BURK|nr:hypothetical protein [Burkholderia stagnalis]KAB0639986.1 hypothetical protein F7R25_06640 [Burkholderia stagnalis]
MNEIEFHHSPPHNRLVHQVERPHGEPRQLKLLCRTKQRAAIMSMAEIKFKYFEAFSKTSHQLKAADAYRHLHLRLSIRRHRQFETVRFNIESSGSPRFNGANAE